MFFFVVAALVGLSPAIAQTPSSLSLEAYARSQSQAAFIGIVANTYAPGSAYPGAIIASPATDTAAAGRTGGQNYYYSWTRDAALTIKTVINQYASGDNSLEPFIKAYIENERVHQHLDTLSGNFTSGGLAEPKYYVNSTAFEGAWGRPQRDGPALRSTAIMGFLKLQTDSDYIKNITETMVKPDLDYVAGNWDQLGFDLWEEQNNLHFFTAMVQARALREGASFISAAGFNDSSTYYLQEEAKLSALIETFWNSTGTGTFDAHLNLTASGKPTGADCGNLLAAIHGADADAIYKPSSSKILASAATLIDELTGLYPIDSQNAKGIVSVGRYASDRYDGIQTSNGNPWFLCTSAMAETFYLAATEFAANGTIMVDDTNLNFFQKVSPSIIPNTSFTGSNSSDLVSSIRLYADQFLALEQQHVGQNFSMAEEFNRTTGAQQGARDLTWSYAAFVTAARARSGQLTYDFTTGNPANLVSGYQLETSTNGTTNSTTPSTTAATSSTGINNNSSAATSAQQVAHSSGSIISPKGQFLGITLALAILSLSHF